jgi:hypothetical protein
VRKTLYTFGWFWCGALVRGNVLHLQVICINNDANHAVRALEHAAAVRPGVDRVRVCRVNRQGIYPSAFGSDASPGVETGGDGQWLAEDYRKNQPADRENFAK